MTAYEKLMKRLPMKYHPIVMDIQPEGDLIDDCKYMLYFNEGVSFAGYENVGGFPVKSITEAVHLIIEDCELVE